MRAMLACLLLAVAAPARPDALPMWELRGAGNRIDILGSIHFLRPGQDSLPAGVLAAYERADVLLMELDLDDLDPIAAQSAMQRLGVDPQGRTLDVLLGDSAYQAAAARARALGMELAGLRALEPWLAAITITQLQLVQLGFDASAGVEQQLVALARRDGKEILGLETLEEQLGALDGLAPAAQRAFLLQTLEEAGEMKGRVDEIVTAWRAGDSAAMEKEFLDGLQDQPDLYRRIVVERNRNWAKKLGPLTRERRDYLVVVGTLHLVGRDSLIGMLERAGHEPVQLRD